MPSPSPSISPAPVAALPLFPRQTAGGLHGAWNARVDAYFERTGLPRRDVPAMYAKAALIFGTWASSWALLTFWSTSWRSAIPLTIVLGMAIASIGMNIMHDANHQAFSKRRGVNRALGWTNDLMGASAYVWSTKHNIVHHTYTNVEGVDDDLSVGDLARMSPAQRWRPWHRAQHVYMWILYCFLLVKWVFFDDYVSLATRRVGIYKLPKPDATETSLLVMGKVAYVLWNIAIPLTMHSVPWVMGTWLASSAIASIVLSVTFQLAHCVEEVEMVQVPAATDDRSILPLGFLEHQLATTADFGRGNPLVTFLVGGLNYQTVHHLSPKVSHIHYPALSQELVAFCTEHGLEYRVQSTPHALASHYRHLLKLGRGAAETETDFSAFAETA